MVREQLLEWNFNRWQQDLFNTTFCEQAIMVIRSTLQDAELGVVTLVVHYAMVSVVCDLARL